MLSTLRLEEPPVLKEATLGKARWCIPFSYEVGEHRRGGRGLKIRFKVCVFRSAMTACLDVPK